MNRERLSEKERTRLKDNVLKHILPKKNKNNGTVTAESSYQTACPLIPEKEINYIMIMAGLIFGMYANTA